MYKIIIKNIQAIEDAVIEFDDNNIVEFTGNNSNGKSVVIKLLQALVSGDLRQKATRRALIRDGQTYGQFSMYHDLSAISVCVAEALNESSIIFCPDVNDVDVRYQRDISDTEGVEAILRKFGFRTYADNSICLQVFPTYGIIPFVTTSGSVNHQIVQDITVDKIAEEFINTFANITFPVFKQRIKNIRDKKEATENMLANMVQYDWRAYEDLSLRMIKVNTTLSNYIPTELKPIPIPNLQIHEINSLHIESIPIIDFYEMPKLISTITTELRDYLTVLDGTCPTCGKAL